jgi:hypothetical protein
MELHDGDVGRPWSSVLAFGVELAVAAPLDEGVLLDASLRVELSAAIVELDPPEALGR